MANENENDTHAPGAGDQSEQQSSAQQVGALNEGGGGAASVNSNAAASGSGLGSPATGWPSRLVVGETDKSETARRASTVSFKEVAVRHEFDAERGVLGAPKKPPIFKSMRYYIMILTLFSPFVTTYSKTLINFAILDMVHPTSKASQGPSAEPLEQSGASQQQQQQQQQQYNASDESIEVATSIYTLELEDAVQLVGDASSNSANTANLSYFDLDNSCPVTDEQRKRLLDGAKKSDEKSTASHGEKFEWDEARQGLLKGAYTIGHTASQVLGGRWSEMFGPHRILCISSTLIGVSCLLGPLLAAANFYLLFVDLILLGMLGGLMTPALVCMIANWLTPTEKSLTMSLYLVSSRLGLALSALLCGLLSEAGLSWHYIFYSASCCAFAFSSSFMLCARNMPQDHPLTSQVELDYLYSKNRLVREAIDAAKQSRDSATSFKLTAITSNGANDSLDSSPEQTPTSCSGAQFKQTSAPTNATTTTSSPTPKAGPKSKLAGPVMLILLNTPVQAFIFTKFCVKFAGDTLQAELPTYLSKVMHFSQRENGQYNAYNYVIFSAGCLIVGLLSKLCIKNELFRISKTAVRKMFQGVASFGLGLLLFCLAASVCNRWLTIRVLMLMYFITTFGTAGEAQIPLDVSERYSGTIHAIGSTLSISGAIEPILIGYLMRGKHANRDSWYAVWMFAGVVSILGGLVFEIFGDAKIQPFDAVGLDDNKPAPSALAKHKPNSNGQDAKSNEEQQSPADEQKKPDTDYNQ